MRKLLLLVLILLSIFLGYSFGFKGKQNPISEIAKPKVEILKVGLVADSHTENDLLAKALLLAKSANVDFVIGLGDYTNLGTIDELKAAKSTFDKSGLTYYPIPGDRDGWESRGKGEANSVNFNTVFGPATQKIEENGVVIFLLDNSDIYKGISPEDWNVLDSIAPNKKEILRSAQNDSGEGLQNDRRVVFIFAHKTPFHPDSVHVMGEDSEEVSKQARKLIDLIEEKKVNGLFTGDLHFFAQFKSPGQSVKITTIGAVSSERNFQGPRFGILKIFDDYSWEVEDVEIR